MEVLLASVAAYTVLFTMLLACAEHLAKPSALSRALRAHRVIPAAGMVAWLVIAGEGLLGMAGIVALLRGGGPALTVALAGCCALLAVYAAYGTLLRLLGRPGACGCSRWELPMTGWVVARAAVLAGLGLLAFVGADAIAARPSIVLATALPAAATFTLLLWHLPSAMHDRLPVHSGHAVGGGGMP